MLLRLLYHPTDRTQADRLRKSSGTLNLWLMILAWDAVLPGADEACKFRCDRKYLYKEEPQFYARLQTALRQQHRASLRLVIVLFRLLHLQCTSFPIRRVGPIQFAMDCAAELHEIGTQVRTATAVGLCSNTWENELQATVPSRSRASVVQLHLQGSVCSSDRLDERDSRVG